MTQGRARVRGVALGGFMGVGKSTVGPRLAARLGLPFLDLDAHITQQQDGRSPALIFAEQGEDTFRMLETAALRALTAQPAPMVLALGGGTLHSPPNLALLRRAFDVVVLHAAWETIQARLLSGDPAAAAARPLWPEAAARYAARQPGYRAAGPAIAVDHLSPDQAADAILDLLGHGHRAPELP